MVRAGFGIKHLGKVANGLDGLGVDLLASGIAREERWMARERWLCRYSLVNPRRLVSGQFSMPPDCAKACIGVDASSWWKWQDS